MTDLADQGGANAPAEPAAAAPSAAVGLLTGGAPPAAQPPAPAAVAPATPPADGKPFFEGVDGLPDDVKAWAASKGFPTIREALEAGFHNERMLTSDKVALPTDDKDTEGLERVYKALGKPDDAGAYGLSKIEGADPEFAGVMGAAFLEAGLSPGQASKLAAANQAYATAQETKAQADFQTASAAGITDLSKEWGKDFKANVETGRRAARQFGLTDALPALERALGSKGMLSMLQKIGAGLGEGSFESGEPRPGFSMTPETAQARIKTLAADKEFGKRLTSGNAEAKDEWARLNSIAYPKPEGA